MTTHFNKQRRHSEFEVYNLFSLPMTSTWVTNNTTYSDPVNSFSSSIFTSPKQTKQTSSLFLAFQPAPAKTSLPLTFSGKLPRATIPFLHHHLQATPQPYNNTTTKHHNTVEANTAVEYPYIHFNGSSTFGISATPATVVAACSDPAM